MTERETPLLPAVNIQTPEDFVKSRFPQLNSRLKVLIKQGFEGRLEYDLDGRHKEDILTTAAKLEEIIGSPGKNKTSIYHHNLKVGYALEKYIRFTSEWEGGSIHGTDFDRSKFTRVFLNAYSHLDNKEAGKFINEFMDSFKPEIVDEHFWNLVEQVKSKCDSKTVGYFARTLFELSDYNKILVKIKGKKDDTTSLQKNFSNNYIKVGTITSFKNTQAFCRGVKELFFQNKDDFDSYADLAINISQSITGDMQFWAIYDSALLEREDIDFTGNQFVDDIMNIKQIFGEKAALIYMMGIVGAVKNKPTRTVQELQKILQIAENKLNSLDWYEKEKERIENSDKDTFRKEILIMYLNHEVIRARHNKDYFIPQQIEDYPKIDPLLFRNMFRDILNNYGLGEACLFSKLWNKDLLYYFDGRKSDFKIILDFPNLLKDFKQSVNEKVYKRAIFAIGKMSNLGMDVSMQLIKDIKECYADKGEKITLGRINYTYGLYYLRGGYRMGFLGGIDGLEKIEGDIYRKRKKQKNENSISS